MAIPTLPDEQPIMARLPERQHGTPPGGLYPAVCADVVDLGLQRSNFGDKPKIRIVWQAEERDEHGRRFEFARTYTNSLAEKAALRRDLESWRGAKFTRDELEGFNLLRLLGANCQLQVMVETNDREQTYANVTAVLPPARNLPRLVADNFTRYKDRQAAQRPASSQGGRDAF
jgi:hypothetical protein